MALLKQRDKEATIFIACVRLHKLVLIAILIFGYWDQKCWLALTRLKAGTATKLVEYPLDWSNGAAG